jgi:hypothetical protein
MLAPDNLEELLIASPDCDEETLRQVLRGDEREAALLALRHPNAPQDEIEAILSRLEAPDWPQEIKDAIVTAVLGNPNASAQALDSCWVICHDPRQAWQMATHPNASSGLYQRLVRVAPVEDLLVFALNRVARSALGDDDLPEVEAARVVFDLRINYHIRTRMIRHPAFGTPGILELVARLREQTHTHGGPESVEMRRCIAYWTGAEPEVTHALEADSDESVRLALLDNPHTVGDLALMWKLYSRPSRRVSVFLEGWLESLTPEERAEVEYLREEIGDLKAIPPFDHLGGDPPDIGLDNPLG